MKNIFLIAVAIVFLTQNTYAQRSEGKDRWEKFRTEKISFLTDNLDLTPDEAQKFWPVYNQMEKEKSEAQEKRRELEKQVREAENSLKENEIIKLTRSFASTLEKEGALMKEYNEEFLKILPPQKVLHLYQTENEFRMHMFRKYRERHGKKEEHP